MLQPEPALDFLVRDDSASFDIGEALLDLVDKVQALHRVLESRVGGKTLDGLKDALLGRGWSGHAWLGVSDVGESTPRSHDCSRKPVVRRTPPVQLQAALLKARASAPWVLHFKEANCDGYPNSRA